MPFFKDIKFWCTYIFNLILYSFKRFNLQFYYFYGIIKNNCIILYLDQDKWTKEYIIVRLNTNV